MFLTSILSKSVESEARTENVFSSGLFVLPLDQHTLHLSRQLFLLS